MKYQFIAEFYENDKSEKPLYKTHLWGVEDGEAFIKKHAFVKVPDSYPECPQYMKEMSRNELTQLFPTLKNFELIEIIIEDTVCRKTIVYAYKVADDYEIVFDFGVDKAYRAHFCGNFPYSRVQISEKDSEPVVDLPLKCFKKLMGVTTLFEVMEVFEKAYHKTSLADIQKKFESGIETAAKIVFDRFLGAYDMNDNAEILHIIAVSMAGKTLYEMITGMFHEYVSADWDYEELLNDGFSVKIVDALRLLTYSNDIPYMDYIKNICESGNKLALTVKINDLKHDIERGKVGGHWEYVAKHAKALAFIQEYTTNRKLISTSIGK